MPTYEYRCKACGEHLEVFQSFTDDPLTTCPACAGELRKVFSPVGIAFKGSGFYKTDSRSTTKSGSSSSSAEPKDSKATDAKSDSKPSETKSSDSKSSDSKSPSSAAAS